MKKKMINNISLDDHLGCFSTFDINDIICKKYCSIRLRCSIESDQNIKFEILNDLVFSDAVSMRIQ